jgi:pyruvate formate lyase activating enzyme
MREARFYEPLSDGRVLCSLCALYCKIAQGRRGACGVRVNVDQTLYTLVDDTIVARHVDPIEKKPLFHFRPGSLAYSIATVGCNFRCLHCQNFDVSQQPKDKLPPVGDEDSAHPEVRCLTLRDLAARIPGETVTAAAIVEAALHAGCESIAYTYTEPTIFFELAYDTARLAAEQGLANIFVTNGYITDEALETIAPYLDAANIDLKSFNDAAHQRMTGARLQPVLDAIRAYKRHGIWTEVTTLVIPGHNDSAAELRQIAEFVRSVGADVPWHVTGFYPTYRLLDRPPTPVATLQRARDIGRAAGLHYVYEGNVHGQGGEDTRCHVCSTLLVQRYGNQVLANHIRPDGSCPQCATAIPGVEMAPPPARRRVA